MDFRLANQPRRLPTVFEGVLNYLTRPVMSKKSARQGVERREWRAFYPFNNAEDSGPANLRNKSCFSALICLKPDIILIVRDPAMYSPLLDSILYFAAYFASSLVALAAFKIIYVRITPHDEWQLIRDEDNSAAAIGFGGAIIGFAIAMYSAITHSVSLLDFAIWAMIALIAQLLAFALVRFVFMRTLVSRIQEGKISAGILLAAVSIAVGMLNAASMSW
jgi:putative membrane protein